jgi:hypothetical protein
MIIGSGMPISQSSAPLPSPMILSYLMDGPGQKAGAEDMLSRSA